jgi:hypothetical protein
VSDIVEQRSDCRHLGAVFVERFFAHFPPNDVDELSGGVEHADGVRETGVRGAWKDELRHPELPDTAQPLKFRRGDQGPGKLVHWLIVVEYDQAMHWITKALCASDGHSQNIQGTSRY